MIKQKIFIGLLAVILLLVTISGALANSGNFVIHAVDLSTNLPTFNFNLEIVNYSTLEADNYSLGSNGWTFFGGAEIQDRTWTHGSYVHPSRNYNSEKVITIPNGSKIEKNWNKDYFVFDFTFAPQIGSLKIYVDEVLVQTILPYNRYVYNITVDLSGGSIVSLEYEAPGGFVDVFNTRGFNKTTMNSGINTYIDTNIPVNDFWKWDFKISKTGFIDQEYYLMPTLLNFTAGIYQNKINFDAFFSLTHGELYDSSNLLVGTVNSSKFFDGYKNNFINNNYLFGSLIFDVVHDEEGNYLIVGDVHEGYTHRFFNKNHEFIWGGNHGDILYSGFIDDDFVYVAGNTINNTAYYKLNKSNGAVIWSNDYEVDRVNSIIADSDGDVYIGGYYLSTTELNVKKLDGDTGAVIWVNASLEDVYDIKLHDGFLYVASRLGMSNGVILRFNAATGVRDSDFFFSNTGSILIKIDVDEEGNFYVLSNFGTDQPRTKYNMFKLDSHGDVVWGLCLYETVVSNANLHPNSFFLAEEEGVIWLVGGADIHIKEGYIAKIDKFNGAVLDVETFNKRLNDIDYLFKPSFNVTIDGITKNDGAYWFLSPGTYVASLSDDYFYAQDIIFTIGGSNEQTYNFEVYSSLLNITLFDYKNNLNISEFSIYLSDYDIYFNTTNTYNNLFVFKDSYNFSISSLAGYYDLSGILVVNESYEFISLEIESIVSLDNIFVNQESDTKFNCSFEFSGAPVVSANFKWFLNDVLVKDGSEDFYIHTPSSNDKLVCSVNIFDGYDYTGEINSSIFVVGDVDPPVISYFLYPLEVFTDTPATIQVDCADDNPLAPGYPRVSFFNPNDVFEGWFTLSHVAGDTYSRSHSFNTAGVYHNFTVQCRDGSGNFAENTSDTNLTAFVRVVVVGGGGGGGSQLVRDAPEVNLSLEGFCGDGICQEWENPFNCWEDCKVNFDTLFVCLWTDDIDCNWEQTWFPVALIIFVGAIGIFYIYKEEVANK